MFFGFAQYCSLVVGLSGLSRPRITQKGWYAVHLTIIIAAGVEDARRLTEVTCTLTGGEGERRALRAARMVDRG